MIDDFIKAVIAQTGEVHQAKDDDAAGNILMQVAKAKQIKKFIASTDDVMNRMNLDNTKVNNGLEIRTAADFDDRKAFKSYVFEDADAGLTGVDYGIAESGTLCLVHNSSQPRLVSLAPPYHIAFLPVSRIVPVYEKAIERIYTGNGPFPSQISFITGPSMTADIKAQSFKGMHGPKHLIVILIEN